MARTNGRPQKAPRHRKTPDPHAKAVGLRVQQLRKALGPKGSFDLVVEETGLGRGYISELERGLVVPGLTALRSLAKALDVTVADLVLEDSPREQLFAMTSGLSQTQLKGLLVVARDLAATAAADRD
jgi:transcriptional regulator with XRE-family HTH domain